VINQTQVESTGNKILFYINGLLESFNWFEQKTMEVLLARDLKDHFSFTLVGKSFGVPKFGITWSDADGGVVVFVGFNVVSAVQLFFSRFCIVLPV